MVHLSPRPLREEEASYAPGLRWLVALRVCLMGHTYSQVSDDLAVDGSRISHSTVGRIVRRYRKYGSIETWQGRKPPSGTRSLLRSEPRCRNLQTAHRIS